MASVVTTRSSSGEVTTKVFEGGKVVAESTVSKEEAKRIRKKSGSRAEQAVAFGEEALKQQELSTGMSSADTYVVDSSGNVQRLTPFEAAVAPRVSTEQGEAIVAPQRLSTLSPVEPEPTFVYADSGKRTVESALRASPFDTRVASAVSQQERLTAPRERLFTRTQAGKLAVDLRRFQESDPAAAFKIGFLQPSAVNPQYYNLRERAALRTGEFLNIVPAALPVGGTLRGAAVVESSALSQIGNPLARLGAGLLVSTAEATAVSRGTGALLKARAPEEYSLFNFDDVQQSVFRSALQTERGSEPNFFRRSLVGLNVGFSRQGNVFEQAARQELVSRGFQGEDLTKALRAQVYRRTEITPNVELATTLQAGRFAEIYGRVGIARTDVSGSFGRRFFQTGKTLFPAGIMEVRGELAGTRQARGSDLPFFSGFRSLFPEISLSDGLRIQSRSQLGQDIGLGVLGGLSASSLGGLVGAGATAPKGARGSRALGRSAELIGNIADISEPFTDVLAGSPVSRIIVPTPSISLVPSRNINFVGGRSPIQTDLIKQGLSADLFPAVPVSSRTQTTSKVQVPSLQDAFDVFVPVDTRTTSRKSSVPSLSNVFTQVQQPVLSDVPSQVAPRTQVPVNVPAFSFANVPVTSFVGRIPAPVPLDLNLGGSGFGYGRGKGTSFVNELQNLFAATGRTQRSQAKQSALPFENLLFNQPVAKRKKKKKKKPSSSRRTFFPDPLAEFNLLTGGFRNVKK